MIKFFFRCSICRSVPETFAIKVESCQKSRRNLDIFLAFPSFFFGGGSGHSTITTTTTTTTTMFIVIGDPFPGTKSKKVKTDTNGSTKCGKYAERKKMKRVSCPAQWPSPINYHFVKFRGRGRAGRVNCPSKLSLSDLALYLCVPRRKQSVVAVFNQSINQSLF